MIEGGRPLHGSVEVGGAKNVAIKLMIAALLSDATTVLRNISKVGDVVLTGEMLEAFGVGVDFGVANEVKISPRGWTLCNLPRDLARGNRAAPLFTGPLLARCSRFVLPLPGGDRIGRRPLDRHFAGLTALGARIEQKKEAIVVQHDGLRGAQFCFEKNTHTGTETMILAAALAHGTTILENAAEEPEIDDLILLLNKMGAKVTRDGTRRIVIDGVSTLHGASHKIMSDRNKAVSFACMALATKGDVEIRNVDCLHLEAFLDFLKQIGAGCIANSRTVQVAYKAPLKATSVCTAPHPGIMSDWQPLITTLLTQAHGQSVVHETVFESRFGYVKELQKMGALIELFTPKVSSPEDFYNFNWEDRQPDLKHAARISGPRSLAAHDVHVNDVRAGATLVQAALTATGRSCITGVEHIERGYENLHGHLRHLGACIEEVAA